MRRILESTPRWCKVWADFWTNKIRTLLVVVSIMVGVFAIGMVDNATSMFKRDLDQSWRGVAPASATLYAEPFDEDMIQSLRRVKSVQSADGRRNIDVRLCDNNGDLRKMYLTAIPNYLEQKVNIIRPLSGMWPPVDGTVLLERSSIETLGITKGEAIEVETPSGHKRQLKVTGVVYDPSKTPTLLSGYFYGYISMATLEKLEEPRQLDQISFIIQPTKLQGNSKAPIEAVARQVLAKLEHSGTTVFSLQVTTPGQYPMEGLIKSLLLLLKALGILAVFLGMFLLVNTINAILAQQTRQVAMMKAIGARRGQIIRMYLVLVSAYGFIAWAAAIPLAALAATMITGYTSKALNFNFGGFDLTPAVILLEVLIAVIVPVMAALWPVWHGTAVTVREGVNDYGIRAIESGDRIDRWVDKGIESWGNLPRPVLLFLRNTFRKKGRLFLTLVTLIMAGTVFIAVCSVRSSLFLTLDKVLDYFRYDISVVFNNSYGTSRIEEEAYKIPGVKLVETWEIMPGRILKDARKEAETEDSQSAYIIAPHPNSSIINPRITEGRWLRQEDGAALVINSDVLRENPQLKIGRPAVIMVGKRKLHFTVVGVTSSILTGPIVYAPYDWLANEVNDSGRARSAQICLDPSDSSSQSTVGRLLEEHFKKNGMRINNLSIVGELKNRIQSQFNIITTFLLMMAVLLAIVGAIGLTGMMSINVLERTREIGVMRAIGASSYDVAKIFIGEALCIGFLGWLGGILLALPVALLICYKVGMLFLHSPLIFSFSFLGTLLWLVISIVLSISASILPAWSAVKMSVRDVVNYE